MSRPFSTLIVPLVFATAIAAGGEPTEPLYSEQVIIGSQELIPRIEDATAGLEEKISSSELGTAFRNVFTVLDSKPVDKRALKDALSGLKGEMANFTSGWHEKVEKPLWHAQEEIVGITGRIRAKVVSPGGGKAPLSPEHERLYENQFTKLAGLYRNATDDHQKARYKTMFDNLYSLKQLRMAKLDLSGGQMALYEKALEVVQHVELTFMKVILAAEGAKTVMELNAAMIGESVDLIEDILDVEQLVKFLGKGGSGALGLKELSRGLEEMGKHTADFQVNMQAFGTGMLHDIQEATRDKLKGELFKMPQNHRAETDQAFAQYLRQASADKLAAD